MPDSKSHTRSKTFTLQILTCGVLLGIFTNFYPATAEQSAAPEHKGSILTTNYNSSLEMQDDVRDIPVDSRIYDVGYVVYSKDFAERNGYPDKYIAELDQGMDAFEFRMKSDGGFVDCYLNALIDSSIQVYLPQQNFVFRDGNIIHFPRKIDSFKRTDGYSGYRDNPEESEYITKIRDPGANKYSVVHYLVTKNYKNTVRLQEVNRNYFKNKIYLSFATSCAPLDIQTLSQPDVALWLLKKANDQPKKYDAADYQIFHIPAQLRQRAVSIMNTTKDYYFLNAVKK